MSKLEKILELYHDYVHHCLSFDDSPEEILGFDEYAERHHGVNKEEANEFFYACAEA
jgi:hypothetical protein